MSAIRYSFVCYITFWEKKNNAIEYSISEMRVTVNKENTAKRKGSLWNFFVHL